MARQMVYRYGENDPSEAEVEGWFDPEDAEMFKEGEAVTAQEQWEREMRGFRETLFHTKSGRWVLQRCPLGLRDGIDRDSSRWEFLSTDEQAVDWLVGHGHEQAVARLLPELHAEKGPGRPEIGGRVQVRLGELLPQVDHYADQHGLSRAEAVRMLISAGLARRDG